MLKFRVFDNQKLARSCPMENIHLVGADNIAVRANIHFQDGAIACDKRTVGPAGLSLQFQTGELGQFTLQTTLLPEREEPYLLTLELLRHRLMILIAKQEDWAMFELGADHPAVRRFDLARARFVAALGCEKEDPAKADKLSREGLLAAIDASEELALAHAELLLRRRRMTGQLTGGAFGCGVGIDQTAAEVRASLLANFDYLRLPTHWQQIEPHEQEFDWRLLDSWAEWAMRNRLPILAGPVISFESAVMPDWLAIVEHDYESLRDLLYEHTERLVSRYRSAVTVWNVLSGIHVNNQFSLNLEQLMDITRMAVMLTRKVQPNARTLIEITQPFGEYYAQNIRSIPPMIYADMIIQSGIPVDTFGVKLLMGCPREGQFTRDLMQISALLDRFNGLGKPIHLTAVGVPSHTIEPQSEPNGNGNGHSRITSGGYWRREWSSLVQGHWLEAFYNIALSKPFIESVAWIDLADHDRAELPYGGLTADDLRTKSAFHRIISLRKTLYGPIGDTIHTELPN